MIFGFFRTGAESSHDDDIATGTYADGAVATSLNDTSSPSRDRSQAFRRSGYDRDYAMARTAGQSGAGLIA